MNFSSHVSCFDTIFSIVCLVSMTLRDFPILVGGSLEYKYSNHSDQ
jgi:hypothetical protein